MRPGIDHRHACLYLVVKPCRAVDAACVNTGGQSIGVSFAIAGACSKSLARNNNATGPKQLTLEISSCGWTFSIKVGAVVTIAVFVIGQAMSTAQDHRAVLLCFLHGVKHVVQLSFIDNCAKITIVCDANLQLVRVPPAYRGISRTDSKMITRLVDAQRCPHC